jgi:hypothetical protein
MERYASGTLRERILMLTRTQSQNDNDVPP